MKIPSLKIFWAALFCFMTLSMSEATADDTICNRCILPLKYNGLPLHGFLEPEFNFQDSHEEDQAARDALRQVKNIIEGGELSQARVFLEAFIGQHSGDEYAQAAGQFYAGLVEARDKKYHIARTNFDASMNDIRFKYPALLNSAVCSLMLGEDGQAVRNLTAIIDHHASGLSPTTLERLAHYYLGVIYHRQGQRELAAENITLAQKRPPTDPIIRATVETIVAADSLIQDLQRKVGLEPDNSYLIAELAREYSIAGAPHRSMPLYKQAMDLDPNNFLPYVGLSDNHLTMGEFEMAIDYVNRLLKIYPDHKYRGHLLKGRIRIFSGELEEAEIHFLEALTGAPEQSEFMARSYLGQIYLLRDQPAKAKRQLQKVQSNSNNPTVQELQKKIRRFEANQQRLRELKELSR